MNVLSLAAMLLVSTGQSTSSGPAEAAQTQPALDLTARVTGLGGGSDEYRGWKSAAGLEAALLARWGRLELGPRFEFDVNAAGGSEGFGLLGGTTIALNDGWSMDFLGEVGAQHYSRDGSYSVIVIDSTTTTGSSRTRLALGARAGLTSGHTAGRRFTFGAFTRYVERTRITYREQECFLAWCSTTSHVASYGGLQVGGFVSWSWDFQLGLPRRLATPSADSPPHPEPEQ